MNFGPAVVAIAESEPGHLEVPVLQMGGRLEVSGSSGGEAAKDLRSGGGFGSPGDHRSAQDSIEGLAVWKPVPFHHARR